MKRTRVVDLELLRVVRTLPCIACAAPGPSDAHHLTTRGAGGDDVASNLISLCRTCHTEWHRSPGELLEAAPSLRFWLEFAGREDVLLRFWKRSRPNPAAGR